MVAYSSERKLLNLQLRDYLYQHLYYNNDVHDANVNAVKMLEDLFAFYLQYPDQLGAQARRRMTETSLHRAVCDYLSGMTDRYTRLQYERLIKKGT